MNSVTTCEITKATKDITINNVNVIKNEYVSIVDGEIIASEQSLSNIINSTLQQTKPTPENMITIYFGLNINKKAEDEVRLLVNNNFSQNEYDFVRGNQNIYDLIISIE